MDPLDNILGNIEKTTKSVRMIKEMRDDFKRAIEVVDKFNKNSKSMLRTLEKLADTIERNEGTLKKLVKQMEKMDKNFEAMAKLLSEVGE